MRTKIFLMLLLFFLNMHFLNAQEKINYEYVATKTYTDYFAGNWKEVIRVGKKSLKKDIDFYYLRVRMGVAYFKKAQYKMAVVHLENAYMQNPKDDFVIEMLYYAYLYAGDVPNAIKMAQKLQTETKEKLGFDKVNGIQRFNAGAMYLTNENMEERANEELLFALNQMDAKYTVQDYKYLYYFGLSTATGKNAVWSLNFSQLKIYDKLMNENKIDGAAIYDIDGSQTQIFAGREKSYTNGWNWSFGTSLLYGKYTDLVTSIATAGRWGGAPTLTENLDYVHYLNFATGATLKKAFGRMDIQFHTNISNLESSFQAQIGEEVNFYPLANSNLYFGTKIWQQFYDGTTVFADSKLGIGVFNKVWLEASYLSGDVQFYTKNNTAVMYNTPEKINSQIGLTFFIPVKKSSFSFSLFSANKTNFIPYNLADGTVLKLKDTYKTLTILGGITWNL